MDTLPENGHGDIRHCYHSNSNITKHCYNIIKYLSKCLLVQFSRCVQDIPTQSNTASTKLSQVYKHTKVPNYPTNITVHNTSSQLLYYNYYCICMYSMCSRKYYFSVKRGLSTILFKHAFYTCKHWYRMIQKKISLIPRPYSHSTAFQCSTRLGEPKDKAK